MKKSVASLAGWQAETVYPESPVLAAREELLLAMEKPVPSPNSRERRREQRERLRKRFLSAYWLEKMKKPSSG